MSLENCPQCDRKLPQPFKSSGRQVCSGCGWSDKRKIFKKSAKSQKSKYNFMALMFIPVIAIAIGILAMEVYVGNLSFKTSEKDREFDLALYPMLELMNGEGSDLNLELIDDDMFVPKDKNLNIKARKLGQYYCGRLQTGMNTSKFYKEITSEENYILLPEIERANTLAFHVLIINAAKNSYCPEYSLLETNTSETGKSNNYSNNSLYENDPGYKLCVDTIIEGGGSWSEGTENCREFKEKYDPNW